MIAPGILYSHWQRQLRSNIELKCAEIESFTEKQHTNYLAPDDGMQVVWRGAVLMLILKRSTSSLTFSKVSRSGAMTLATSIANFLSTKALEDKGKTKVTLIGTYK